MTITVNEVRSLEGYVTFPQAAKILGVSKQGVHVMAFRSNVFGDSVRKVGEQPTYLLRLADVHRVARIRAAQQRTRSAGSEAAGVEDLLTPGA